MKKKNDIDYLAERAALRAGKYDPPPKTERAIMRWLKATPKKENRLKFIRKVLNSLNN